MDSRRGKKPDKNNDYLVRIISVQITVCAVIFCLALAFMRLGGEGFQGVMEEYRRLNERDIPLSDLKNMFSGKTEEEPEGADGEGAEEKAEIPPEEPGELRGEETQTGVPLESDEHEEYNRLSPVSLSDRNYIKSPSEIERSEALLSSLIKTGPVIPVAGTRITSGFGWRKHPITKVSHLHSGTDFGADEGDPVSAVLDGAVIKTDYSKARGNFLIIRHEGGRETWYCHCQKILVEEGTRVRAGETVALAGSTGDSNGPHLHLEIHIDGEPKDPMETLFKNYAF